MNNLLSNLRGLRGLIQYVVRRVACQAVVVHDVRARAGEHPVTAGNPESTESGQAGHAQKKEALACARASP